MYSIVSKCISVFQDVLKWFKMYPNAILDVLKCIKCIIVQNVSKCIEVYQNVLECFKMYSSGLECIEMQIQMY